LGSSINPSSFPKKNYSITSSIKRFNYLRVKGPFRLTSFPLGFGQFFPNSFNFHPNSFRNSLRALLLCGRSLGQRLGYLGFGNKGGFGIFGFDLISPNQILLIEFLLGVFRRYFLPNFYFFWPFLGFYNWNLERSNRCYN